MKKLAFFILLFTAFSAFTSQAQTPKTNATKIYSFTGKQVDESIITSGEDYTPTAKLKTLQTKIGLTDVKYKKLTGGDVVSVIQSSKNLIGIPKTVVTKLEADDKSAFAMVAFALALQAGNSEAVLKQQVFQADRKALKIMKENMDATAQEIKIAYNKILETPAIIGYPTKEERLKIVKQFFDDATTTTGNGNTGGNNNGGDDNNGNENEGNDNSGNNNGNGNTNNNADCHQSKTGTVTMINNHNGTVDIIIFKGSTLEGEEYMPITVGNGKTAYLYEVTEGVHAWKTLWNSGPTGQINVIKCQGATITID